MISQIVKHPGGGGMIIDQYQPKQKCFYCANQGTQLCDFVLPSGRTHDRPLCKIHAIHVAVNKDYCPEHKPDVHSGTGIKAVHERVWGSQF